jgi:esterase/lipase superfamily enzyme
VSRTSEPISLVAEVSLRLFGSDLTVPQHQFLTVSICVLMKHFLIERMKSSGREYSDAIGNGLSYGGPLAKEASDSLSGILQQLGEVDYQAWLVLVCRVGGGMDSDSIATDLQINSESVNRKLARALTWIRKEGASLLDVAAAPGPNRDSLLRGVGTGGDYAVWFGTNRRPLPSQAEGAAEFSSERDSAIHYGICRVSIPRSHQLGSLGSSWWRRVLTLTDDRLKLVGVQRLTADEYWRSVAIHHQDLDPESRHAIVYIHGYNVTFQGAALRAAQIGFDLGLTGAMSFFSWPSHGKLASYILDEAAIEASEALIANFLVDTARRSGADHVHVIAHSMGNRGFLRAMQRINADAERRSTVKFSQVILAAPDVDVHVFNDLARCLSGLVARSTLYVCDKDVAVEASRWLHGFPRAGLTPPIVSVPGVDTISVSALDLTLLGHGYAADSREVLADIHAILMKGSAPDHRFGIRRVTDAPPHWQLRP